MKQEYKEGDIIVCIGEINMGAQAWQRNILYKVERVDTNNGVLRVLYRSSKDWGVFIGSVRLATDLEKSYFKKGLADISNIPKDSIINNYLTF